MIKIQNARKWYAEEVKIGPLNIEIPKAGITSLIGPNGAGKSTTLLMIGRLLHMDEGQITVANMDVSTTKSNDLAKVLTILRQENHFVTRLTVRQLVGFGRFPYSKGRLTREDEKIISKYIDFFELTELEHRFLDELSGGRARINIVTGSSVQDLVELGDPLAEEHDERYRRTAEFLQVLRSVWTESGGPGVSSEFSGRADGRSGTFFEGGHYSIKGGTCFPKPVQRPHPPIFFGGSSRIGKQTAAAYADVFLMWAEPVPWIREQIAEMEGYLKEYEAQHGVKRDLQYGLRAQVLIRPTEEEAWKAAWELISKADPQLIEKAREEFANTDATNQRRQNELREQSAGNDFVVGPNMWMGLSLLRSGGALLLVGTADQVTDRLLEYVDIGITKFILSGYPHLEEAEIFGREAVPLLRRKLAERNLALAHQP